MENNAIIDGMLFIKGSEGISIEDIMNVFMCSKDEAKTLLESFINQLNSDENRGLEIAQIENSYYLRTKARHLESYQRLFDKQKTMNLSQAALETLAIVAYNQPITRVEIDQIRGVSSDGVIRNLLSKNMLEEVGRQDSPGRPQLIATTTLFLDFFNLQSLEELPELVINKKLNDQNDLFSSKYHEEE